MQKNQKAHRKTRKAEAFIVCSLIYSINTKEQGEAYPLQKASPKPIKNIQ
ncbi:hypothetical protein M089_2548 [Bacteroides ovatus str. 3725 D9 iii]|nr:hypothetical protein M088_4579 [Bacteroides ovatus str. 3725 D1 iv]KDS11630.1 hypothetical protein M082_6211 [Bacteroides fragilis str. 3725 D9 ii]KDS25114.1 hypothetical protein M088_4629 [Bacteroides ovatus str. 3725 D1 iv]KDS40988.1 hypothetical protein M089_2548 [Bacteroides ovatus str. 3725 D9 iii]